MDLLSLVLTLHPLKRPDAQTTLPLWWGRAAHALLLHVIAQYNPPLSTALHGDTPADGLQASAPFSDPQSSLRPFTVSTLIGRFPQGQLDRERPYMLRLTGFEKSVTEILWNATHVPTPTDPPLPPPLAPGQVVELDYIPFRIETVQPSSPGQLSPASVTNAAPPSPWAGATDYPDLSAPYLLAKENPPRQVTLQFTAPTVFKSSGMHVPIPLPGLVFGSLLERWNAFAPLTFPPELKRYAEACLAVSRYNLSSRSVPVKSRGLRVGGMGEITYTTLNYDRYWMSLVAVLAEFAIYAGAGAGTTMGLGQCRWVGPGNQEAVKSSE
jgi:CRISPR-associated endoribonuclease Cas6